MARISEGVRFPGLGGIILKRIGDGVRFPGLGGLIFFLTEGYEGHFGEEEEHEAEGEELEEAHVFPQRADASGKTDLKKRKNRI